MVLDHLEIQRCPLMIWSLGDSAVKLAPSQTVTSWFPGFIFRPACCVWLIRTQTCCSQVPPLGWRLSFCALVTAAKTNSLQSGVKGNSEMERNDDHLFTEHFGPSLFPTSAAIMLSCNFTADLIDSSCLIS